jgi:hypothetical protein
LSSSVLFLFIDGIGIGPSSEENPFTHHWEGLEKLNEGQRWVSGFDQILKEKTVFKEIDANLGVEGLPQSGTGQVSLFTGENASELIGKHYGPYPHSQTKPLLQSDSIFETAKTLGRRCAFLNAYPPRFFEWAESRNRWSTTTLMCRYANVELKKVQDVNDGKAITAEILQDYWASKLGMDVPQITEKDAARRAWNMVAEHDITLYEYYLTDKAGHSQSKVNAKHALQRLDNFVDALVENQPVGTTLVLTSDHGNLEDLSTKSHTRNTVPLAVLGEGARAFQNCESILDVKQAMLSLIA